MGDLRLALECLATVRAKRTELEQERTLADALLRESHTWKSCQKVQELIDHLDENISARMDNVRLLALEEFERTGDKHPHPNVTIREGERPYYDYSVAIDFAREQGAMFLTLNRKYYEVALRAGLPVPGCMEPKITAAIDRDLSDLLPKEATDGIDA